IAFDPARTSYTYGDAPFTVSATGGASGQPVTLAATDQCTVAGTTVTITGAGGGAITASQAGTSNYLAAADVTRSFAIAKATPALTWNTPAPIVYGTSLGNTQLNAAATFQGQTLAGTFAYTPPAGTVLGVGAQTLS